MNNMKDKQEQKSLISHLTFYEEPIYIKGEKGNPGADGIDGHTPTDEELTAIIEPLIPEPLPAIMPTKKELVALIKPLIPAPIKGEDGQNGKDAILPTIPIEDIIKEVERRIKIVQPTVSKGNKSYKHGGGDIVLAGSNITIVTNSDGSKTISSTVAGGTWYQGEAVGGTINSVNKTFTLAHSPTSALFLWLGHQLQIYGVDYTIVGSTITYTTAPDTSLSGDHYATYS